MSTLNDDLAELRRLKDAAEAEGTDKKAADAAFKQHMAKCLERMEIEEADSFRSKSTGYLFSVVDKVKGQIEDRKPYVRWALENDAGINEFLTKMLDCVGLVAGDGRTKWTVEDAEDAFFDAIMNTSVVTYKEDGGVMNQQARSHVDDEAPLPPGLTFRPDPSISMRKS